ncbi:hypothetical protein ACWGI9_13435 [Streptomyces sp. NPDC054833]|jgi:hypothetical protein
MAMQWAQVNADAADPVAPGRVAARFRVPERIRAIEHTMGGNRCGDNGDTVP